MIVAKWTKAVWHWTSDLQLSSLVQSRAVPLSRFNSFMFFSVQ